MSFCRSHLLALRLVVVAAALHAASSARAEEPPPVVEPDAAPPPKKASPFVASLDGAFGAGALRVGTRAADGASGSVSRAPVTIEELTPSLGLRTKNGSLVLMNPLLLGAVAGSRTGVGTGNLSLKNDQMWGLGAHFDLHVTLRISAPTGTSEEQPSAAWGPEQGLSDSALVGGALHAAARAASGYTMGSMWDSHRFGLGSHIGLRIHAGPGTIEPYVGADSRLSFTGRKSPGNLLAGLRNESRLSERVVVGAEVWVAIPDPDMRSEELSSTAAFAQVDAGIGLGRLKGTLAAMMPVAGPSDAPRVFAFRAGIGAAF